MNVRREGRFKKVAVARAAIRENERERNDYLYDRCASLDRHDRGRMREETERLLALEILGGIK